MSMQDPQCVCMLKGLVHHQDSVQAIPKPQKQQGSKGWRELLPDKLLEAALAQSMAAA